MKDNNDFLAKLKKICIMDTMLPLMLLVPEAIGYSLNKYPDDLHQSMKSILAIEG